MKNKMRHPWTRSCVCGWLVLLLLTGLCMATRAAATEGTASLQTVQVGIPVEEHPELFIPRSMPTRGEAGLAVFLIDFPDNPNENPLATREYYDGIYFSGGVQTQSTGYVDTVAEYYRKQSFGKLNISGQVFDWYTAKHERSYYDYRKDELVEEAAEYYRSQGVDFSQFDCNADGILDGVIYHFAGPYSTDAASPWYPGVNYGVSGAVGELTFNRVIQICEDARADETNVIVTACHELMHSLGMPDLYSDIFMVQRLIDDLMSAANASYINPFTKMMLGWVDEAKVITGDMENVRLEAYGNESDDFVIVTDEYGGLFDEYFLVVYKEFGSKAVIYHIDARLNEDGTALMNDNQSYNPRPDKPGHYHGTTFVPHLLIEELSGDPDMDFVLNVWATWINSTEFVADSVLGPNAMPSSDTHDGAYTGIRIHGFEEHNDEYLTFDVSFVQDHAAPEIITRETELKLQQTVTVKFNESVYAGENFESIRVTDLKGNALDVKVILPDYPKNELELNFRDTSYEKGYQIILPERALRDSSGNYLPAGELTASGEQYLFPTQSVLLPSVGDHLDRDGYPSFFFEHENDVVVINALIDENLVYNSQIEFMRLDMSGNVLAQTIIENPARPGLDNLYRIYPIEMSDGSYVIFSKQYYEYEEYRVIFCLDANGELKWVNDTYRDTPFYFQPSRYLLREDGVVVRLTKRGEVGDAVFIDAQTGQIDLQPAWQSTAKKLIQRYPINLSGGQILCQQSEWVGNIQCTKLVLLDAETYEIEAEGMIEGTEEDHYYVASARRNEDGTIILFCTVEDVAAGVLLDAKLNVVRIVPVDSWTNYSAYNTVTWMYNDGFCVSSSAGGALYEENVPYHIQRYDRYLNLLWETDLAANFGFYFKSPAGEVLSYRCAYREARGLPNKCYIDTYGSEEVLRGAHRHELVHVEQVPASCKKEGMAEYWYCTSCGCYFTGIGQNPLTDPRTLVLPITDHRVSYLPAEAPTCGKGGKTEGRKCADCSSILVQQQTIPATGEHQYGSWQQECQATCTAAGSQFRQCAVCSRKENREMPMTMHGFGPWQTVREATAEAEGEQIRSCTGCGKKEARPVAKLPAADVPADNEPSETPVDEGPPMLLIVLVAAVILGGAGAAVFLLKKKK